MPTKTEAKRQTRKQAEHAAKVADLTEGPAGPTMGRKACITYLQAHGAYSGHSRDSLAELQQVVTAHQAEQAARAAGVDDQTIRLTKAAAAKPDVKPEGVERVAAAKAEHKALAAWRTADATHQLQGGPKPGPRPATPNLDAINEAHEARGGKPRTAPRKAKAATNPADRYHNPRYADVLANRRAGKRGAGKRLTDAEMVAYIGKVLQADPEADLAEEREIAYWCEGIALGRPKWAAAWAQATEAHKAAA